LVFWSRIAPVPNSIQRRAPVLFSQPQALPTFVKLQDHTHDFTLPPSTADNMA